MEKIYRVQMNSKGMPNFSTAVEVPQGEWEIYVISPFDGEDCRCSECGQTGCVPYWDYCPNCGARMKGVDDEADRCRCAER